MRARKRTPRSPTANAREVRRRARRRCGARRARARPRRRSPGTGLDANTKARPSIAASSRRGTSIGASDTIAPKLTYARPTPRTLAIRDSTIDSQNNCRTICSRRAPRANLTATSRLLPCAVNQQQRCRVGARNQQQRARGAGDREERRTSGTEQVRHQRGCHHRHRRVCHPVLQLLVASDGRELGDGVFDGCAGRQAAERVHGARTVLRARRVPGPSAVHT